jgi:F0F1-type ATP synthase epsilon subunit
MMNLPKKLINVMGGVMVLGILTAGVTVVALPVYLSSTDLDSQRQQEQQANASRQIQVEALRSQAKARASLDAEVSGLK